MWGISDLIKDIYYIGKKRIYYNLFSRKCKICGKKLYLSLSCNDSDELSCKNKTPLNECPFTSHYKITIKNHQIIDQIFFLKEYIILISDNEQITVKNNKNKKYIILKMKIKYDNLEDLLIKIKKYSVFY